MDALKKCKRFLSSDVGIKTIFYLSGFAFSVYSFGWEVTLLLTLYIFSAIVFGFFFFSIYLLIRAKRDSTKYPVSKWIYKLIASVMCVILLLVFADVEILIYALLMGIVIFVVPLIFMSKWVD